jgi:hypothetical protein
MPDHTLDPAADLFRDRGRLAIPLTEIAGLLPGSPGPDRLAARMGEDGRFIVAESSHGLPGLEAWSSRDLAAYDDVLRRLDLPASHLVLFRHEDAPTRGDDLSGLLWRTLLELLSGSTTPPRTSFVVAAVHRAAAALDRLSPLPPAAEPSTSLPPGPPPPCRTQPPLPLPALWALPPPGSLRG